MSEDLVDLLIITIPARPGKDVKNAEPNDPDAVLSG
jgi:hypothetical protein